MIHVPLYLAVDTDDPALARLVAEEAIGVVGDSVEVYNDVHYQTLRCEMHGVADPGQPHPVIRYEPDMIVRAYVPIPGEVIA